jgi:hypothetical protein
MLKANVFENSKARKGLDLPRKGTLSCPGRRAVRFISGPPVCEARYSFNANYRKALVFHGVMQANTCVSECENAEQNLNGLGPLWAEAQIADTHRKYR